MGERDRDAETVSKDCDKSFDGSRASVCKWIQANGMERRYPISLTKPLTNRRASIKPSHAFFMGGRDSNLPSTAVWKEAARLKIDDFPYPWEKNCSQAIPEDIMEEERASMKVPTSSSWEAGAPNSTGNLSMRSCPPKSRYGRKIRRPCCKIHFKNVDGVLSVYKPLYIDRTVQTASEADFELFGGRSCASSIKATQVFSM